MRRPARRAARALAVDPRRSPWLPRSRRTACGGIRDSEIDELLHMPSMNDAPLDPEEHARETDGRIGDARAEPKPEEIEKNDTKDEAEKRDDGDANHIERFHMRGSLQEEGESERDLASRLGPRPCRS